jgi:hypothetical protein
MPRTIPTDLSNFQPDIDKLCLEDSEFKELYHDYLKCVDALEYWGKDDSDEAPELSKEYHELTIELEKELLRLLLNSN